MAALKKILSRDERALKRRLDTRRANAHERRIDPMATINDCEKNCTLAAKSHERLNAAFARIDEIRDETRETDRETNGRLEKLYGYIQERVKFQLFIWVVGATIALQGSLMGIIWAYLIKTGNTANLAIDKMETSSKDNARDIRVVITRIDDYIKAHNEALRRAEQDQGRVLNKLDEIELNVRDLQIAFGSYNQQILQGGSR